MTRHDVPRKLRLIFHLQDSSAPDEGIDIVVIPGVPDRTSSSDSRHQTCSWIKPLVAATTNDTRVYYYSFDIESDKKVSPWDQLLNHGSYLLDSLNAARQGPGEQERPILFICHSLGGVVLKKALVIAHQILPVIEKVVCGIVFLGTPHSPRADNSKWDNWAMILKSNRKDIPRNSLSSKEIKKLADTCMRFENLNMQVPILSVFEKKETKVRENLISSLNRKGGKSVVLVDENVARIGARLETLMGCDVSHADLVVFPIRGETFDKFVKFLKTITDDGPGNVELALRPAMEDQETLRTRSSLESLLDPSSDTHTPVNDSDSALSRIHIQFPILLTSAISRNPNFFGQQSILDRLDETLLPNNNNSQVGLRSFALCAMGGMGKTEIAIEYALSRKDKFDAIFWLSADTVRKLTVGYVEVSRALQLEDPNAGYRDEAATRELVKGWLSRPRKILGDITDDYTDEANWLIIFDNADDPDVLAEFWPVTGNGAVLITSRDPIAKDAPYTTTSGLDLQPLSDEEGGELLKRLSKRGSETDSDDLCRRITHTLGGLPLAITQMAGIIHRRHYSLTDFEESYNEDAKRLQEMKNVNQRLTYNQTVATVWAIDDLSPIAIALLKVVSFLDPDRIKEKLLTEGSKTTDIQDYPKTKSEFIEARYELIKSSLITRNAAQEELRVHRLVQDVVRNRLDDEEWMCVFRGIIKLLFKVWPFTRFEDRNKPGRWPQYDTYIPHSARVRDLLQKRPETERAQAGTETALLFDDAAWYMCEKAANDEIQLYAQATLAVLKDITLNEESKKEREVEELRASSELNIAIAAQGRVDGPVALKHTKIALRMIVERIDHWHDKKDSLSLAICYNNLGIAYNMVGDTQESLKTWELSHNAFRDREGSKILDSTWPAVSISLVYSYQGEVQKATELLTPIYEALLECRGRDDRTSSETGVILRAMGHLRIAEEKFTEGLDFHQRALLNLRATLGRRHFQTADCMYNLAQDLLRFARTEDASKLLDEAIEAWGDNLWYRPTASRALWRKGRLLRDSNKELEAEGYLRKAMSIRRVLAPGDQRDETELVEEDWTRLIYYYSR